MPRIARPLVSLRAPRQAALAIATATALLLTACGSDSDDGAPASGSTIDWSAAGTAPEVDSVAFPVTIEGQLGSITLEEAPERVVSVGQYRDTDAAVALGVVPLATPDLTGFIEGGISPWVARELAGDTPELFDSFELPFEQIAALEPELILGTDRSALDEEYATLSEIAPTLSYANGYNKDEWQLTTERVATALGRADQAAPIIAEVEAAVEAARADNPEFDGATFTFGPVTADGTVNTINSTTDASVIFLEALGLELSPAVQELPDASFPGRAVISPEQLDLLDADVLMLTFNTPEARETLEANPLFQALPAVQRGSYVALELPTALALAFPSALSIPYGLEQVVPKLAAAIN